MQGLAGWLGSGSTPVGASHPMWSRAWMDALVSVTDQPAGQATDVAAGGADNTVTLVMVAVIVIVIVLVAVFSMRRKASGEGESDSAERPERERGEEGAGPSRDVLAGRQRVEKPSEIGEDDSLAEIKKKKMEKVAVSDYAEAKRVLDRRKAGKVKEAARSRRQARAEGAEAEAEAEDAETDEADEADEADASDEAAESADEAPRDEAEAKAEPASTPEGAADADADVDAAADGAAEAAPVEAEAARSAAAAPVEGAAEAEGEGDAASDGPAASSGEPGVIDMGELLGGGGGDDAWGQMDLSGFELGTASLKAVSRKDAAEQPKDEPKAADKPKPAEKGKEGKAADKPRDEPKAEPKAADKPKAEPKAADKPKEGKAADKPRDEPKAADKPKAAEKGREGKAAERPKDEAKPAERPKEGKAADKPRPAPEPSGSAPRKSLQEGLQKTRGGFVSKLGSLFKRRVDLDEELVEELEEVLYTADIGPTTVRYLIRRVEQEMGSGRLSSSADVWGYIRRVTEEVLTANGNELSLGSHQPFVMLVVGVNGVGKTTTIGKLATKYTEAGRRVLLVAGDTFRAAATEQLEEWGERTGLPVHIGVDGKDPASVIYDGIRRGEEEGYDVVICDTAGRLTNKKNLMQELEKIGRVSGKALTGAPHETLLVLDANTGLMAIQQAQMFREVVDITGIALTKLDGTAKGGVVIGISKELGVPVRYIGIGEGVHDLRDFDAREFVEALFM